MQLHTPQMLYLYPIFWDSSGEFSHFIGNFVSPANPVASQRHPGVQSLQKLKKRRIFPRVCHRFVYLMILLMIFLFEMRSFRTRRQRKCQQVCVSLPQISGFSCGSGVREVKCAPPSRPSSDTGYCGLALVWLPTSQPRGAGGVFTHLKHCLEDIKVSFETKEQNEQMCKQQQCSIK